MLEKGNNNEMLLVMVLISSAPICASGAVANPGVGLTAPSVRGDW